VLAILVLHAGAGLSILLASRFGRRVFLLGAIAPAVALAWLLGVAGGVVDGEVRTQQVRWVDALALDLSLRLDAYALVMALLVSGVGVLVFLYAWQYFGARADLPRLASVLVLFSGSMLGLVLADSLFGLFVFWELTTVTSYLLIGTDDDRPEARAAARHALVVTGGGGLAMLGGFVILAQGAGSASISAVVANPPGGAAATVAAALVVVGAATKSAQVPFHGWLPGAMAAPTPVSAYLHSATMVKAGVYLAGRVAPSFAEAYDFWRPTLLVLGSATMLAGGAIALGRRDLKQLLAYGTVSQLGFLMVLLGAGIPELTFAGTAVLLAHGLFKSSLFMVAGIVDHQAHSRNIGRLDGIGRRMPAVASVAVLAAASMIGLPVLFGFVAKESALEALLDVRATVGWPTIVALVAGSALTAGYAARFVVGAFGRKRPEDLTGEPVTEAAPPPLSFLVPAAVPALAGLVLGVLPVAVDELVGAASASVGAPAGAHLELWHGFTAALGLSTLAVLGGALLEIRWRLVTAWWQRRPRATAANAFERAMDGLGAVATRLTAIVQSGSLPVYLAVTLMTFVVFCGWALASEVRLPDDAVFADSGVQVAAAATATAAAVGAALAGRRFVAVLLLGAVGYSVAVLFVVQGAPDLALTQFLVETLSVVLFVLVLRQLPERFARAPFRSQTVLRAAVALSAGVLVTLAVLSTAAARTQPPVSDEYLARALPDGGGKNVVNVILTDFRALDTMGEITVLAVAAVGVASLVAAVRRERRNTP
jgi:multicomponent Na+:H+ antiporter subunit A